MQRKGKRWVQASVSELGFASVAGHSAHEAVLLLRPDGGEDESLLVGDCLPEIRVELLHHRVAGGSRRLWPGRSTSCLHSRSSGLVYLKIVA